jgi:glucose-1-phosphate thymidylyltransferase
MLDWIRDRIDEVDEIDATYVVTNARYAQEFERWAEDESDVHIVNDGTASNEDRLGAIGDIRLTIDRARIDDDLMVIAGDNLFDYSLRDYVAFWRDKGVASAVALYRVPDPELVKQYGVVELDETGRLISFVEKPPNPTSDLAATATYIYHRQHVPRFDEYIDAGNPPDQPGNFVAWLLHRDPVYGYEFEGTWLDIGDREQLLEADNTLRREHGLPERFEYSNDN